MNTYRHIAYYLKDRADWCDGLIKAKQLLILQDEASTQVQSEVPPW